MKIVITGHTRGLGKSIYDHYVTNHEVIGLSSSTGYDISTHFEEIVEIASGADYFFNNVSLHQTQARFIERLYDKTKIITSGSMGSDFALITGNVYHLNKSHIEAVHKRYKRLTDNPMLLLKMGYLESNHSDKMPIDYVSILSAIDLWMSSPRISLIEFENHPVIYTNFNKMSM